MFWTAAAAAAAAAVCQWNSVFGRNRQIQKADQIVQGLHDFEINLISGAVTRHYLLPARPQRSSEERSTKEPGIIIIIVIV